MESNIPLTTKTERIPYLDSMRGLAILGIFIVNIVWFAFYDPSHSGSFIFPKWDAVMLQMHRIFIDGKFYSIFSVLFGWGMALQLKKLDENGKPRVRYIRRRLWAMLLLGGIHLIFLWEGDIVFFYGLLGFILLSLRNISATWLLCLGIVLLAVPVILYLFKMEYPLSRIPSEYFKKLGDNVYKMQGLTNQDTDRTCVLTQSKSWLRTLGVTFGDMPYRFAYLFKVSRGFKVLGAMVIGFVIGSTNVYQKIQWKTKKVAWLTLVGLLISIPLNVKLANLMNNGAAYDGFKIAGLYYTILFTLAVFPLALCYMSLVAMALETSFFGKLLSYVAPVGKMAFSNYIIQTCMGILLFYSIGFGWYGALGLTALTLLAIVLFGFQVVFSYYWLKYFKLGPIEWIWRSITYGQWVPIRNRSH